MRQWYDQYRTMVESGKYGYGAIKEFLNSHMPDRLFRYRTFDKHFTTNCQGEVHMSYPQLFNDDKDSAFILDIIDCFVNYRARSDEDKKIAKLCAPYLEKKLNLKDGVQELIERIRNCAKIACFTDSDRNNHMWENYAEENKGFCIEYDISKNKIFKYYLFKVIYDNNIYDLKEGIVRGNRNYMLNPFIHKTNQWMPEQEWRLVWFESPEQKAPNEIQLGNEVVSIKLGEKAVETYPDEVEVLKKICRDKNIVVR